MLHGKLAEFSNLVVKKDFLLSKLTEQQDNFADVRCGCRFLNLWRKFGAFSLLETCSSQPLSKWGWFTELRSQSKRKIHLVSVTGAEVTPHYLTYKVHYNAENGSTFCHSGCCLLNTISVVFISCFCVSKSLLIFNGLATYALFSFLLSFTNGGFYFNYGWCKITCCVQIEFFIQLLSEVCLRKPKFVSSQSVGVYLTTSFSLWEVCSLLRFGREMMMFHKNGEREEIL